MIVANSRAHFASTKIADFKIEAKLVLMQKRKTAGKMQHTPLGKIRLQI